MYVREGDRCVYARGFVSEGENKIERNLDSVIIVNNLPETREYHLWSWFGGECSVW